jgi:hypothetical protein
MLALAAGVASVIALGALGGLPFAQDPDVDRVYNSDSRFIGSDPPPGQALGITSTGRLL